MEELTSATTVSSSSLKSMSTSSSSSLNLSKLEDEPKMNCRSPVGSDCCHSRMKRHCQQNESRFFLVGESDEGEHHFLDSCFLCQKEIFHSHEIFMYRGDEAFCSEKCRTQQMEMDESLETVERRHRLIIKSSVSYKMDNYAMRNSSEEQQSIFSIQKRPTIANLIACGLISMQNSGFGTNMTFM